MLFKWLQKKLRPSLVYAVLIEFENQGKPIFTMLSSTHFFRETAEQEAHKLQVLFAKEASGLKNSLQLLDYRAKVTVEEKELQL